MWGRCGKSEGRPHKRGVGRVPRCAGRSGGRRRPPVGCADSSPWQGELFWSPAAKSLPLQGKVAAKRPDEVLRPPQPEVKTHDGDHPSVALRAPAPLKGG